MHRPGKKDPSTGRAFDIICPISPAVVFASLGGRPHDPPVQFVHSMIPLGSVSCESRRRELAGARMLCKTASRTRLHGKQWLRPTPAAGPFVKPSRREWTSWMAGLWGQWTFCLPSSPYSTQRSQTHRIASSRDRFEKLSKRSLEKGQKRLVPKWLEGKAPKRLEPKKIEARKGHRKRGQERWAPKGPRVRPPRAQKEPRPDQKRPRQTRQEDAGPNCAVSNDFL